MFELFQCFVFELVAFCHFGFEEQCRVRYMYALLRLRTIVDAVTVAYDV